MTTRVTTLPTISTAGITDPAVKNAITTIQTILNTRGNLLPKSNPDDAWVTRRDLVTGGLAIKTAGGFGFQSAVSTSYTDKTVPTPLTGLAASGGVMNIILTWDASTDNNYSFTEIWRSGTNDVGTATRIGTTEAALYGDYVGATATYYYWIRAVNTSGMVGPWDSTVGVQGTTNPIDYGNFASSIEPISIVNSLPSPVGYTGPTVVFLTTDDTLYRYTGSAWTTNVYWTDVSGTGKPADNATVGATIGTNLGGQFNSTNANTFFASGTIIAGLISAGAISTSSLFVDGVITGTKIAAATITVDKLLVANLAAISADMGTVTAGTFATSNAAGYRVEMSSIGTLPLWFGTGTKSAANAGFYVDTSGNVVIGTSGQFSGVLTANAVNAVNTINLAGQAVTIPVSAYSSGSILLSTTSQVMQTCVITSSGAPIAVNGSLYFSPSTTSYLVVTIERDGTQIYTTIVVNPIVAATPITFAIQISDTPGAGSHTYTISSYLKTATTCYCWNSSLMLLETKR